MIMIFRLFNKVYKSLTLVFLLIVNTFLTLIFSVHICGYTVAAAGRSSDCRRLPRGVSRLIGLFRAYGTSKV